MFMCFFGTRIVVSLVQVRQGPLWAVSNFLSSRHGGVQQTQRWNWILASLRASHWPERAHEICFASRQIPRCHDNQNPFLLNQAAAKGGRQKEFDHFFSIFGHFLVTFLTPQKCTTVDDCAQIAESGLIWEPPFRLSRFFGRLVLTVSSVFRHFLARLLLPGLLWRQGDSLLLLDHQWEPFCAQRCWTMNGYSLGELGSYILGDTPQNSDNERLWALDRELISKMARQKCNVNCSARILGWIFWCEFWAVNFLRVNFWGGSFYGKHRAKKFDPRIRPQNSGLKNSHPRIRPQIRVREVQTPLCGNLPLRIKQLKEKDSPFLESRSCLPGTRQTGSQLYEEKKAI